MDLFEGWITTMELSAGTLVPVELKPRSTTYDDDGDTSIGAFLLMIFIAIVAIFVRASKESSDSTDSKDISSSDNKIYPTNDSNKYQYGANASNKWQCPCGRHNPLYLGQCICGRKKVEVLRGFTPVSASRSKTEIPQRTQWKCLCGSLNPISLGECGCGIKMKESQKCFLHYPPIEIEKKRVRMAALSAGLNNGEISRERFEEMKMKVLFPATPGSVQVTPAVQKTSTQQVPSFGSTATPKTASPVNLVSSFKPATPAASVASAPVAPTVPAPAAPVEPIAPATPTPVAVDLTPSVTNDISLESKLDLSMSDIGKALDSSTTSTFEPMSIEPLDPIKPIEIPSLDIPSVTSSFEPFVPSSTGKNFFEASELEWKCTCGQIHANYIDKCGCGKTREEVTGSAKAD